MCIAPSDGITRDTVLILYPRRNQNLGYVYQVLNADHFFEYATKNSYGTEQPVLSISTVLDYLFPCAGDGLDFKYSSLIQPYIDMVLNLQIENRYLVAFRNFLLPLLMNGQVQI